MHRCTDCVVISYLTCIKCNTLSRGRDYGHIDESLWDHDGEDADNIDEDIKIEDEKSKVNSERGRATDYPTQALFTPLEVQDMVQQEMEKSNYLTVLLLCW